MLWRPLRCSLGPLFDIGINSYRNNLTTFNSPLKFGNIKRCFRTSVNLRTFWEKDEKGGYTDKREPQTFKERMRMGIKELKSEIKLWSKEMKEDIASDPFIIYRAGETDVVWDFKDEKSLDKWNVTSDHDHGEGFSNCSLTLTNTGKALFCGDLSTRVPKDGRIKRAGYCNIKTHRVRKSFKRDSFLEWSVYNCLVIKVRGDGRSYMLTIGAKGYYDNLWNDVYHHVLYTRGGPYWQVSKIPFSKFFLSSKGRIQDRQSPLPQNRVTSFGISVGDKIDGPFSLEIDYIGVENDPNHTEEFAYEMYELPKYMAAT